MRVHIAKFENTLHSEPAERYRSWVTAGLNKAPLLRTESLIKAASKTKHGTVYRKLYGCKESFTKWYHFLHPHVRRAKEWNSCEDVFDTLGYPPVRYTQSEDPETLCELYLENLHVVNMSSIVDSGKWGLETHCSGCEQRSAWPKTIVGKVPHVH